jgi:hypothetical protein
LLNSLVPVDPVIEVPPEPVGRIVVVPVLHPDVGKERLVEPGPPVVDVMHHVEHDRLVWQEFWVAGLVFGII